MLLVKHCHLTDIEALLKRFQLKLSLLSDKQELIGSFWGGDEAGLKNDTLFVKQNTPIHSLLHEACHYICMDNLRRSNLDTNAGGDYDEENAVCFLQILLADHIAEMGRETMFKDMDTWGYTFRLGSSTQWFYHDAEDAQNWLEEKKLINAQRQCLFLRRD